MGLLFFVMLGAASMWFAYGRPRTGFLPGFARLIERPEYVDGFDNRLAGRWFLKGEFRGRKIVILVQDGKGKYSPLLVVSMETSAPLTMATHDFAGYRADRDGELALFALEVKHELALRHEERCLKAAWRPLSLFFPGAFFDEPKWRSVLEAMHTLAGSIERRASAPAVSAAG
jgi:hypothetical protein